MWVKISEKKNINFSRLRSRYHRLTNRKKLILPLKKILQNFEGHDRWRCWHIKLFEWFTTFQSGRIMVSKYRHLMPPWGISRWSYPWHWFYRWSSSSVWCFSSRNTPVGAVNLQMVTNKFWYEYLWGPYVLSLDPVLCIVLVS